MDTDNRGCGKSESGRWEVGQGRIMGGEWGQLKLNNNLKNEIKDIAIVSYKK